MPLKRLISRKERKEYKRLALVEYITVIGFDMFLCTNCERNNRVCVLFKREDSSCCFKCVAYRGLCNVEGIPVSDQSSLSREEARLRSKKENAFYVASNALACVARLKKQQKQLRKKGKDMLRYSLQTLDELEEVERGEEKEQKCEATLATEVAFIEAQEPFTFLGGANPNALLLPSTAWVDPGSASGTLQAS